MKIAHYDEAGQITFFAPELLPETGAPEPNITVEDEEWRRHVLGEAIWRVDATGDEPILVEYTTPPPSLAAERANALRSMERWISELLAPFTAGVPPIEVQSWGEKARAAKEHVNGTPSPMIEVEAAVTGEDAMVLARTIKANAERYERIIAMVTGLRRSTRIAVEAATDPTELPDILEAAQAQALIMAKNEGIV